MSASRPNTRGSRRSTMGWKAGVIWPWERNLGNQSVRARSSSVLAGSGRPCWSSSGRRTGRRARCARARRARPSAGRPSPGRRAPRPSRRRRSDSPSPWCSILNSTDGGATEVARHRNRRVRPRCSHCSIGSDRDPGPLKLDHPSRPEVSEVVCGAVARRSRPVRRRPSRPPRGPSPRPSRRTCG